MDHSEASGTHDEYAAVAEFYDYIVPYLNREDLDFYVDMAKESGGPVLEVGCGTGRILIPIARAGIEVTGLDLSPSMLALCRKKLSQEPAAVQTLTDAMLGSVTP